MIKTRLTEMAAVVDNRPDDAALQPAARHSGGYGDQRLVLFRRGAGSSAGVGAQRHAYLSPVLSLYNCEFCRHNLSLLYK
jgi:hypothetical protein